MIEETYVSFETAKLLKEKGFDEPCKYLYEDNGERYTHASTCYQNICDEGECLCPTQAMAMRWLRGKNIFIFPNPRLYVENGELKLNSYHVEIASNKTLSWKTLTDEYKSYEDACEAAIKYCLENLI